MHRIKIADQQQRLTFDRPRLRQAVKAVLQGEGISKAQICVAIVDDPQIHELNRRFLNHDEPTDVLSFALEQRSGYVEGEIVVSADTAASRAGEFNWPPEDELLLYVVHGTLHLAGYDDKTPELRGEMRRLERHYLGAFGLVPPYDDGC
ncbi:MAG TPA: rRNA maturation RNase YbeY [Pirellulales bacterium]|nr:rRNA maturation RNase YbeY [Pirellulales bacterium]